MVYSQPFRQLVQSCVSSKDNNVKFVGLGNPDSLFLFIGKECAIDCSTTRGLGCYNMEHAHNANQWMANIENDIRPDDVPNWLLSPIDEHYYNPLYPYRGQLNKKAFRDRDGSVTNQGTSSTWLSYQKLMDCICKSAKPIEIDFHQNSFVTELSDATSTYSKSKNAKTEESIQIRCEHLLNTDFFRLFPVTIVACGHYVRDYHIDLQEIFRQKFVKLIDEEYGWYSIHEYNGRLLIHTRQLSMCSDALISEIGTVVRSFLINKLLQYCLYYKPGAICNDTYAFYEQHWIDGYIRTSNKEFDHEVLEMQRLGIPQEWLDSFKVPYSLIGLFYNRYYHWIGMYDKDLSGFMKWFEKVRE